MLISQYRWQEGSAVNQIDVRTFDSGALEAFIYAPEGSAAGALGELPVGLRAKGFNAVTDEQDGQNVLRVTGFKNENELFKQLEEMKIVGGTPSRQDVGEKTHIPLVDKIRRRTVNLSGMSGLIGHASMAVAGVIEKDMKRVATSAFYGASTSIYAFSKPGTGNTEFDNMVKDMKKYLKTSGVELPQGAALTGEELAKKGGAVEKLTHFMNEHPMQVGNAIGLVGNLFMMASGRGEMKDENTAAKQGIGRTLSGAASLTAALAIILIPEKAKEKPIHNPDGTITQPKGPERKGLLAAPMKAFDWVREKPMRFAGMMFLGSNVALAMDARQMQVKYKNNLAGFEAQTQALEAREAAEGPSPDLYTEQSKLQHDYNHEKRASKSVAFAYTTAASYFLASTFTALSSKTASGDVTDQEMLGKLCAYSANFIAEQPQDVRDRAVNGMAEYLASQPNVTETRESIVNLINDKVEKISQGPWVGKLEVQQSLAARSQQQGAPASGASL